MTRNNRSKFYLVARQDGSYEGTIQLENGKRYSGRIYANKSDKGLWYRGDLTALDAETHIADGALLRDFLAAGEETSKGVKPLELRLNPWPDGKVQLIGTLVTSDGSWTVFANTTTDHGRLALRGSIRARTVQTEATGQQAERTILVTGRENRGREI